MSDEQDISADLVDSAPAAGGAGVRTRAACAKADASADTAIGPGENNHKRVRQVTTEPEIGGRNGPDPTRFGDWEIKGRCIDF